MTEQSDISAKLAWSLTMQSGEEVSWVAANGVPWLENPRLFTWMQRATSAWKRTFVWRIGSTSRTSNSSTHKGVSGEKMRSDTIKFAEAGAGISGKSKGWKIHALLHVYKWAPPWWKEWLSWSCSVKMSERWIMWWRQHCVPTQG